MSTDSPASSKDLSAIQVDSRVKEQIERLRLPRESLLDLETSAAGSGSFSDVFKGRLRTPDDWYVRVAVKRLRTNDRIGWHVSTFAHYSYFTLESMDFSAALRKGSFCLVTAKTCKCTTSDWIHGG